MQGCGEMRWHLFFLTTFQKNWRKLQARDTDNHQELISDKHDKS